MIKRWIHNLAAAALLSTFAVFVPATVPVAQAQQQTTPNLVIPFGQVVTFNVPDGIATLLVGNGEIIRVTVPPDERYAVVTALKPGVTNMLIWTKRSQTPINYIVEVAPNNRNEQVAVRVKVYEVDTGNDGNIGIDWSDSISFMEAVPNAPFKFGMPTRPTGLSARLDTLVNDRKARLLAEPTLVVLNGKEAEFLSGGELPMVITDRDRINVQWREYGINLKLKAMIEGTDTIEMHLTPEVSDIDRANSLTIANQLQGGSFVVPAFKTRRADTTLRVQNNQSIVIAGLLQNSRQEVIQKFPLLGDIPILGWLFSTINFQERRSELVFVVTPTIVRDPAVKPEIDYAKEAHVEPKKP